MKNESDQVKKLGYIDSLRGFAVLAVLMVHCADYGTNNYPDIIESITGNGGRGVQLFFIVSAFTLFLSLHHRSKKENNVYSNFFIRRFFRIAPMFYLAIIYNVVERLFMGYVLIGYYPDVTPWSVISSVFFLHGLSPYWINNVVPGGWTITNEMMFYCMIPFLFKKIKNLNHAAIAFIIAVFIQHCFIFLVKQVPFAEPHFMKGFLFFFLPNHLPVFACGIFLYFLVYTPKEQWKINPLILLFFPLSFLLQLATGRELYSQHVLFSFAFVAFAYVLSIKEFKIFVNPVSRFLGKISYSMYLVHFAVLHLLFKFDFLDYVSTGTVIESLLNLGIRYSIVILLTVIISYITYRLIEKPFQQLGKRIIKKRETKTGMKEANLNSI
ncbi:acyltransferase [Prevotella sp. 10(H)]|uniref:acyltransferase family protein n=1 Tax=Prevotella sp. 10(H) TaxID=1158294 RepID=UPI0004A76944|nr:acyltransferase [Prevotella sp. 10(H)]